MSRPGPYSLDSYDFELPESLIAQEAVEPRDSSRLMVIERASGCIMHRRFSDLGEFLRSGDELVVNNTRVLRARLLGQRILPDGSLGGKVEFLMLKRIGTNEWEGLFHATSRAVPGFRFHLPTSDGRGLVGEITQGFDPPVGGTCRAKFDRDPISSGAGEVPLPPYIERRADDARSMRDEERYQTVYSAADKLGSAAAPTAGLHFTSELVARLRAQGIGWNELTLHVGAGTFRPVKTADIREHRMHSESFELTPEVAERLNRAHADGRRVVAVGTTSVRALESAAQREGVDGKLEPQTRETDIFIYPGYRFRAVDAMITNFHLPKSSLIMMIAAFFDHGGGVPELWREVYTIAVREKYRFFSYGDAMVIL